MSENSTTKGHPKGLYVLFVTEMWERFSYYGMRAILMLFMTKVLLFDSEFASGLYGNYTGLVYLTPLIGGFISDKYWGNRRSIFIGGILMAIGQFCLFFSASFIGTDKTVATILFGIGLTGLIIGNGFFKPNISTMVNQLYPKGDKRVDAAFSIFYMGINLGAFFSPLVCGTLAEKIDFKWGFFAAGIGMIIGVIIFELLKNKYVVDSNGNAVGMKPSKNGNDALETELKSNIIDGNNNSQVKNNSSGNQTTRIALWVGVLAGLWILFGYGLHFSFVSNIIFSVSLAASGFIITDPTLTKIERSRIWVIYIIAFFVIFFWSAFEQAGAALTLFADKNTDRMLFGWEMPASYFQSVNPLAIILIAPIFAMLWVNLGKRNQEPPSPVKQAIGLFLLAVGYLIIAVGVKGVDTTQKINMMWLFSMYIVHTLGELCLSPIGLSMVARLSPIRLGSLLMGVWFMSNAMSNDMAGMLSKLFPEGGEVKQFLGMEIATLYDFFMIFVVMAGVASVILYFLSKKLLTMMHGVR